MQFEYTLRIHFNLLTREEFRHSFPAQFFLGLQDTRFYAHRNTISTKTLFTNQLKLRVLDDTRMAFI